MSTSEESRPYTPIFALPYWDQIGPFVHAAVADAAGELSCSDRALYAATTPLVLWCWQSRGMPLQRSRIFRRSVIDEFAHRALPELARGSTATHRSTLWRMAEILNPDEGARPHYPIARSDPLAPYSAAEVASLHSWAGSQSTKHRIRDARALLMLGLGCGLATRELLAVEAGDITGRNGHIGVTVWAGRTRHVPLLEPWHHTMQALVVDRPTDEKLFRPGRTSTSSGQVTDFLTRSRTALDIRPSRMRTTWLLHHLEIGTPPQELLQISGLKNLAALDKISHFSPGFTSGQKNFKDFFPSSDQEFL
jgi:integrase